MKTRVRHQVVDKRFGRLLVLNEQPTRRSTAGLYIRTVRVQCDCGTIKDVAVKGLVAGTTKSCGCKAKPHGHACKGKITRAFRIWNGMRNRCSNPENHSYFRYGARGIKVCERWNTFLNFLTDMGEPTAGMTIDRIDNGGNYELGNCRWATVAEQCRNRRNNIMVANGDKSMCLKDYCATAGLNYKKVHRRLRDGMSLECAIGIRS